MADPFWRRRSSEAVEVFERLAGAVRDERGVRGELAMLLREAVAAVQIASRDRWRLHGSLARRSALGLTLAVAPALILAWLASRPLTSASVPSAFPDAGRLVQGFVSIPGVRQSGLGFSWPQYQRLRRRTEALESLGVFGDPRPVGLVPGRRALQVAQVTPGLLTTLGARPIAGRLFHPEEATPGQDDVALVSAAAWRDAFGGAPGVLGSRVEVEGRAHRIVGVLPESFRLPGAGAEGGTTDVWTPFAFGPGRPAPAGAQSFHVIGRLGPGYGISDAGAEMAAAVRAEAAGAVDPGSLVGYARRFSPSETRRRQARVLWFSFLFPTLLVALSGGASVLARWQGAAPRRPRAALAIVQTAWAALLVACAVSVLGGARRAYVTGVGWDADRTLVGSLVLPAGTYETGEAVRAAHDRILGELARIPGISAVGISGRPLVDPRPGDVTFEIVGYDERVTGDWPNAELTPVSPGFFAATGMKVVRGRPLAGGPPEGGTRDIVINETLARRFWPDDDPVGARVVLPRRAGDYRIVGVVQDARNRGLGEPARPQMFIDLAPPVSRRAPRLSWYLVLGSDRPADALRASVGAAISAVDRDAAVGPLESSAMSIVRSLRRVELAGRVAGGLALLSLLLSAAGVYHAVRAGSGRLSNRPGQAPARSVPVRHAVRRWGPIAGAGVGIGGLLAHVVVPRLPGALDVASGVEPSILLWSAAAVLIATLPAAIVALHTRRAPGT